MPGCGSRARPSSPARSFPGAPGPVPVVTRYDYGPTGFSAAHLGDAALHRWHTPAGLVTGVRRLLGDGARFVYAYYEGIDKVAHAGGLGEYYDDELRGCGPAGGRRPVRAAGRGGAGGDGRPRAGRRGAGRSRSCAGDVMDGVTLLSGEGRFRWLHVRPGAVVMRSWRRPRMRTATWPGCAHASEIVEEGGWVASLRRRWRLGWATSLLAPFAPTAFLDPADTGELRLEARHGSLTPDEMLVPLLSWPST